MGSENNDRERVRDIVERLTAEDILTSIITSVWCEVGRHPGELADLMKEAANEIEKLRREAAIRIDQIEREQEAHLRTIADYNRVAVENEKLRERLAEADEANRLHLQDK